MASFLLQQHSAKLPPLVVAAGSVPRYLLWAQDLPSGAVTTWPAHFNGASATLTGGLVRSDTGYNGRRALYLDGGDYVNLDALLGSLQSGQERTVVLALRLVAGAGTRCILSDAESAGTTSTMVRLSLDASDFATVTKSGGVSSATPQVPEEVPLLLTFRSNGTALKIFMRKRGVDTELLSTTLAETTNVHDQHTLFAHRFQAALTQYATGYLRLATEFAVPLADDRLQAVWDLLESAEGYDCPTVEEPEMLLANVLGVTPHVVFYGPDLTVGAAVAAVPNRGSGPDGTGLAQPATLPQAVTSYNGIPTVRLRGDGIVDWTSSIDGGWGNYNTQEVVLMALQYGTTFANSITMLSYESSAAAPTSIPSRWLETLLTGDLRNYQVFGNNTAEHVTTTSTPLKPGTRLCIAFSLDGSGNARMLIRSRTQLGAFNQHYVTGTIATAIATAIAAVRMGGRYNWGSATYTASDLGDVAFLSISRGVSVNTEASLISLVDLIESRNGLNLPMGKQANQMNSAPQPSALKIWYDARLQVTAATAALDDLSTNNADATSSGVTQTGERFDFGAADTVGALPSPAVLIAAGTGSLACVAIVSKRPGSSLTAGDYVLASGNNTGTAVFLSNAGNLGVLWNNTFFDSGYDLGAWLDGEPHVVGFNYDETNLRFFVDDMDTPLATAAPGAGRTTDRTLWVSRFGTAVGWRNYIHSIQYWVGAPLTGAGEMQAAAVCQALQLAHFFAEGDSNTAIDGVSPAGAGAWWYQLQNIQFTAAGYLAAFDLNTAASGSTWASMLGRGAALDAGATAGNLNVLVVGSHSSFDVNTGSSLSSLQAQMRSYFDARRASGKWHKIILVAAPPQSRNVVNNMLLDNLNAWLPTLIAEGRVDVVVDRPPELDDSKDTAYFLPNTSSAVTENYNTDGLAVLADALLDAVRGMVWGKV